LKLKKSVASTLKNKVILAESNNTDVEEELGSKRYKHLRIPEDLYNELLHIGGMGDSFGSVIERLVKYWKVNHKENDK
jgi:hypothetical protein